MLLARTFLFVVAGILCLAAPLSAETLVLGSVNDNVRKHVDRMTPMARYLERELAGLGITEVRIKVAANSAEMSGELREGRVDLYFDSPLVAAHVARNADAVPFLRRWKRGEASYHSLIIVPADSDINDVDDLIGRRIGFQEPDSTSGYLLPAGMINAAEIPLRELPERTVPPDENEIGYVFTGDDKNTLLWLARGWIDAGATDPRRWQQLEEARPGQFRIIATSIEVPRQVVIRRSDMDTGLLARIAEVLQSMHRTEDGKAILEKFHKTGRFDEFPRGIESTFAPIYELLDRLEAAGIT